MPQAPATPHALPDPATHQPGETTPNKDGDRTFKQQHERDESSSSQQRAPDPVMQQAAEDLQRGLVDTSRADATNEAYSRNLRTQPQGVDGAERPATPGSGSSR